MKKLLFFLLAYFLLNIPSSMAIDLEEVKDPKEQFYRLGTTDTPEKKIDFEIQPVIQPSVQKEVSMSESQNLT